MAKVYIFTDENEAIEQGSDQFDEYLSDLFEDRIFLMSEDNKFLFETEDVNPSLLIQEYFD